MTRKDDRSALARITDLPLAEALTDLIGASGATRALHRAGIVTLGDFLLTPRSTILGRKGVGPRIWEQACSALEERFKATADPAKATARTAPPQQRNFATVLREVHDDLAPLDRDLLDAILGIGRRAQPPERAALMLRIPLQEIEGTLTRIRKTLGERGGHELQQLGQELEAELRLHEGALGVDDLQVGTLLHTASRRATDPAAPLRLLALWQRDRYCIDGDRLCAMTSERLRVLVRHVRQAIAAARPPVRISALENGADLPQGCRALLAHVVTRTLKLAIELDPTHGEIVSRPARSLHRRLESILEESESPLLLDDLVFRHRDRFGSGRRARIVDALHSGGAFIQVAPATWSLRTRHLDELELLRPEAERIALDVATTDRRVALRERVRRAELSERSAFLLIDLLRHERAVRSLGRGEFCARRRGLPPLVEAMVRELRRAMGEVPFARFLQNQPQSRRRLVSRLLRQNRLFVSTARDRVDLLENWPFDPQRLQILLRAVRVAIEERGGYASIARIRPDLAEAGFSESFLHDHILLDVLRRHGDFELLPGGFVASRGVGLARWILRTARRILRAHVTGLSLTQLIVERPELAEFEACLGELLSQDPMVQSADGLNYQIV